MKSNENVLREETASAKNSFSHHREFLPGLLWSIRKLYASAAARAQAPRSSHR
jgi:hypothetical protein